MSNGALKGRGENWYVLASMLALYERSRQMARSLSEMMRDAHAELRADYWDSQFSGEDAKGVLRCMQGINEALASVVDDLKARISALEMQNDTRPIDYRTARLVAPLLAEGKVEQQ